MDYEPQHISRISFWYAFGNIYYRLFKKSLCKDKPLKFFQIKFDILIMKNQLNKKISKFSSKIGSKLAHTHTHTHTHTHRSYSFFYTIL